jgi:hypothetical protein
MKARILGAALAPSFLLYLAAVNIVVFTLSVAIPDDPHPFLDEWGPVSILSGFQLLTCGFLALEIHKSRPAWIWKLMGWGFFFLCADEMLQLHESMDRWTHWLFGIQQTRITNHLDDVIVGLYGLAGVVALFAGRAEIVFFRRQWWLFALGFIGFAVMVAFDMMGAHILDALWSYLDVPEQQSKMWAEVVEEGFKLAGGFFCVAALRKCWEGLWLPSSRPHPSAQAVPAE